MIKNLSLTPNWGIPIWREEEEMLLDSNAYGQLYSISDLLILRDAIDKTLLTYEKRGLDDGGIDMFNDNIVKQQKIQQLVEYREFLISQNRHNKDSLYLILNEDGRQLKIGRSKNPESRLKSLQIGNGSKLKLLYSLQNKGSMEDIIHATFNHIRLNGEWFQYDDDIIDYFEKLSNEV